MLDYRNYNPEEFASDPSFRNWKLKGREKDTEFWTQWIIQNPDKQRDIKSAVRLLEAVHDSFDQIAEMEMRQEIHRIAELLDESPATYQHAPIHRLWDTGRWLSAAVVLLALVSLGWWLSRNTQSVSAPLTYSVLIEDSPVALTEVINGGTSVQRLALPDGSTVTLQPGSKLSYEPEFGGMLREVYLSGEAFFEVAKNPEKPFFVYADQLVTKVLGTSFTVKAKPGENQIQVLVKTGRVSVYANPGNTTGKDVEATTRMNEVVLTPNQKVVFIARQNQFARSLVETPELLSRADEKPTSTFKGTPIKEVFESLEKAYGIKLIFDEEIMQNCYLTGAFTDETLFEKLDLITRTLNASYEQIDGQILIRSRGC
jgi:transmembrane sensor